MEKTKQKLVIYQLFVRYFGNQHTTNTYHGAIEENGAGKFNDINEKALTELKKLGVNCLWFTGVVEHATMTDYTANGIKMDDPDVVKGRAGSPYAIKDYYDVDPDLAENVPNRLAEYEALIQRTHDHGLKVLMDFVPNHVARTYHSDVKPSTIVDLGATDNTSKKFDVNNDFYYLPGEYFVVPAGYHPGGANFHHELKDGSFDEFPAKATGNDVFSAAPSLTDWFETIKLNYGVDYQNGKSKNFVPHPPLWKKMLDILCYWASKGVDGFRCDMVEMVPVEFWNWVITSVKKKYPEVIFIGEAYDANEYSNFIFNGKFDYLYDKVGLYDSLRRLIEADEKATVNDIANCEETTRDFSGHMLQFLENHDEQRIASREFAGNPWFAVPGMVVAATLSKGPLMIYNGQEVGEPAVGEQGFSGNDGRSSIFDYYSMPEHQKWINNGNFDGGRLSDEQKSLRNFYRKLLHVTASYPAIVSGDYLALKVTDVSGNPQSRAFAFVRFIENYRILVVANFGRENVSLNIDFPAHLIQALVLPTKLSFTDLLSGTTFGTDNSSLGFTLEMPATSGVVLEF